MPDISPVARAIVAAFDERYELCGPFDENWQELCLAAALRAVMPHIQIVGGPIHHPNPYAEGLRDRERNIVMTLEVIAAELEGAPPVA